MNIKPVVSVLLKVGYLHEFFHWLPVRLFGGQARMSADQTSYEGDFADWQMFFIVLLPLIVGLIGLGISLWLIYKSTINLGKISWIIFWLGWILGCGADFTHLLIYIRTGDWTIQGKE
jgi:hypothetical protein